jgi:hypothetical protein
MLFFPATEPLSSTPDANRYLRALEQAATNPSASGDSIAWSIDDAAAYWAPDWKPPSPKSKTLPADAVMGMVTRAFLIQYGTFMPIEVFFRTLQCLRVSPNGGDGPYQSISAHGFCYAAHMCAHTTATLVAPDSLDRWTFSIGIGGTTWGAALIARSWPSGSGGWPGMSGPN